MIKLLILTGPTGSGKSALIRLLSRSYGFEITDWETPFRSWSIDIGKVKEKERQGESLFIIIFFLLAIRSYGSISTIYG